MKKCDEIVESSPAQDMTFAQSRTLSREPSRKDLAPPMPASKHQTVAILHSRRATRARKLEIRSLSKTGTRTRKLRSAEPELLCPNR